MVNALVLFLMFLMTVGIPLIAIIAELSKTTPNSIVHSIVRSVICLGSLFFLSELLQVSYKPCASHFLSVLFIFSISLFQLFLEMNHTGIDKIIQKFKENKRV